MSQCYDSFSGNYFYCSSTHTGAYIAIGVVVPLAILVFAAIIFIMMRRKQRRAFRARQQIVMSTITPVPNTDQETPAPYGYPYPPDNIGPSGIFDKPPSYEQTVQQQRSATDANTSSDQPAIVPISTIIPPSQQTNYHPLRPEN